MSAEHPGSLASGTVIAGRWTVVARLGSGGFGAVYEVTHTFTGKRGALKVLKAEGKEKEVLEAKMYAEAQLLSSLKHPHLVEVYDAGRRADGAIWMVMELLQGRDLCRILAEEGALGTGRALGYAEAVAGAVAPVHDVGVIHRDLKPDNVFITDKDVPKVIDFGTSRFSLSRTMPGKVVGTIPYMSPEHLRGEDIDGRTDVWALGVMLYEMVTGRHPLRDAETPSGWPDNRELVGRILHAPLPPLPASLKLDPVAVLIDRATHKSREQRFPSMAAFAAAIQQARGPAAAVPTARLSEHELGIVQQVQQLGRRPASSPEARASAAPRNEGAAAQPDEAAPSPWGGGGAGPGAAPLSARLRRAVGAPGGRRASMALLFALIVTTSALLVALFVPRGGDEESADETTSAVPAKGSNAGEAEDPEEEVTASGVSAPSGSASVEPAPSAPASAAPSTPPSTPPTASPTAGRPAVPFPPRPKPPRPGGPDDEWL